MIAVFGSFFLCAMMQLSKSILYILVFIGLYSCGMQYYYQGSKVEKEDTRYIYSLPYPKDVSHLVIQGYNSKFSHRGRIMLDFKMKRGSPICAARSGVVVSVQDSFSKGGANIKYLRKGNSVAIRHNDSTQAFYGHLQFKGALVSVGDTVQQGQLIAYSGNTGFSAFPHLHFVVWRFTPNGRIQLPTRFRTRNGFKYLQAGLWYKSV